MASGSRKSVPASHRRKWGGIAALLVVALGLVAVYVASHQGGDQAPSAHREGGGTPSGAGPRAGSRLASDTCPASGVATQKGIAVLWAKTPAAQDPGLARHIASYVRTLGANSLSVNFLVSTSGPTGTRVFAGPETPSVSSLRQMIAAAKAAHLRVALRPLIDETNLPRPQWRGSLGPSSPTAWFASYGTLMASYARLAQSTCIDEFVIGAELNSLQKYAAGWESVLTSVRAAGYGGDVTYAANWDAPASLAFAPRSGVDFYPKLPVSNAASTSQLTDAMVAAFRKMPASFLTSLVVQETGLSAYGGRFRFPSLWNPGSAPTFDLQAKWFTAACNAARTVRATGLYYWGLDTWTDPLQPSPNALGTFAFVTRPAADAVRRCFAQAW